MPLRYYDQVGNTWRFKRRYVWAFWSGMLSLLIGLMIGSTLLR